MSSVIGRNGAFSLQAYCGDWKTLLAFNFRDRKSAEKLAGFTIQVQPKGQSPYYLFNSLRFEKPANHAQVAQEPANSSINAPIHKFRWVHVPGSFHQGIRPFKGEYTYTAWPRLFDDKGSLLPLDQSSAASVKINVQPFSIKKLELGFTRGFTQSQAFVNHFGLKALIRPKGKNLLFDTSAVSGTNAQGKQYTFAEEYEWLGYTARERIFGILNDVVKKKSLSLKVFAYDLNEPDLIKIFLGLAKEGRIQIILDNAALHHNAAGDKPEDEFEKMFKPASLIRRTRFGRYAHDKVFIVSDATGPQKVLTGSTNFSVTGLCVNSNHILIFTDPLVARKYSDVFDAVWNGNTTPSKFAALPLAAQTFSFTSAATPPTDISFSPHTETIAKNVLGGLVTRVQAEAKKPKGKASVLFAVMEIGSGTGDVYPTLRKLHTDQNVFSYGISDTTNGISLYRPGSKQGVLVTGKPVKTQLPPPFNQVPGVGLGHQVHHKFVVCGFDRPDAVVYCGSSNLAELGEQNNGDNLLAIHHKDVATAFGIEALALVDHFDFLDRVATKSASAGKKTPETPSKAQAAESAEWFLSTSDRWVEPYFDARDLHCIDRELFGA